MHLSGVPSGSASGACFAAAQGDGSHVVLVGAELRGSGVEPGVSLPAGVRGGSSGDQAGTPFD